MIIRHHARNASLALAAALALAACSRGGDWRTPRSPDQGADSQNGYVAPPRFTAAARLSDGETEIVGRADANSHVRLSTPDGATFDAVTDSRGAFSLAVPAAKTVRLFGLSEDKDARRVQGEGYLAVMPSPGRPAVMLRAGVGAQAPGPPPALARITAVDFDAGGTGVASGLARPGTVLKLFLDGAARADGEVRADGQGRFSFALATALKPGDHDLLIQFSGGEDHVRFNVSPSEPISGLPFRAERQTGDWRIDWLTPGGGEQTTLIMD